MYNASPITSGNAPEASTDGSSSIGSGVPGGDGGCLVLRGQNEWGCSWEIPRYYHDPRRQRPDYFLSLPWVLGSPMKSFPFLEGRGGQ